MIYSTLVHTKPRARREENKPPAKPSDEVTYSREALQGTEVRLYISVSPEPTLRPTRRADEVVYSAVGQKKSRAPESLATHRFEMETKAPISFLNLVPK
ncbi:hypothetical protein GN956_G27125 [Arapaima gigas]